jgi:hypothetical protein
VFERNVHYEDAPQAGLILIPPSSPEYAALLADIRARCIHSASQYAGQLGVLSKDHATQAFSRKQDTPAVFLNRGKKAIAFIQVLWCHETPDRRALCRGVRLGRWRSLAFPLGLTQPASAAFHYWSSIFPGSKRYLPGAPGSNMLGDNTDVRPPVEQEIWKGGRVVAGSAGGTISTNRPLRPMTISIEGAFFMDGQFAGSNRTMLFEQVTGQAAAYLRVAKMARDSKNMSPRAILTRIERITGKPGDTNPLPPLPPENTTAAAYQRQALQKVANQLAVMRTSQTAEQIVRTLAEWSDANWPNFQKWQPTAG